MYYIEHWTLNLAHTLHMSFILFAFRFVVMPCRRSIIVRRLKLRRSRYQFSSLPIALWTSLFYTMNNLSPCICQMCDRKCVGAGIWSTEIFFVKLTFHWSFDTIKHFEWQWYTNRNLICKHYLSIWCSAGSYHNLRTPQRKWSLCLDHILSSNEFLWKNWNGFQDNNESQCI